MICKKHIGTLLIVVLLCALIFSGCSSEETSTEPITLWVVTEVTPSDAMNARVQYYIDQFQSEHPNVSIQLDILPYAEPLRADYIKELYEKIESGEGPDIYLLPDRDILQTDRSYWRVDPLFPDVELAMRAGIFADISRLYNSDFRLGKSALQKTVMDAGVVDGCRYVLPLRYEINTVYYFPDLISGNAELDRENWTISDLMQYAIDLGDPAIASAIDHIPARSHYTPIETFSNLIDYDSGKITLTQQELEEYLSTYQKLAETIGLGTTIYGGVHLHNVEEIVDYAPVRVNTVMGGIAFSAYAQKTDTTLKMAPVRTNDGDVVATVSYFGAIGSDCKNVETAYEFLRIFLSEEAQWEAAYVDDRSLPPLGSYGWPVRAKGATPYFYNTALKWTDRMDGSQLPSYKAIEMTDEDLPVLDTDIDIVRFHFCNSFYTRRQELNDYKNNAVPSDVDIAALADAIIQDIENTYNTNLNSLPKIPQNNA